MEIIAGFSLCLALALTVYAFAAAVIGVARDKDRLIYSSYRAVAGVWLAVSIAIGILRISCGPKMRFSISIGNRTM